MLMSSRFRLQRLLRYRFFLDGRERLLVSLGCCSSAARRQLQVGGRYSRLSTQSRKLCRRCRAHLRVFSRGRRRKGRSRRCGLVAGRRLESHRCTTGNVWRQLKAARHRRRCEERLDLRYVRGDELDLIHGKRIARSAVPVPLAPAICSSAGNVPFLGRALINRIAKSLVTRTRTNKSLCTYSRREAAPWPAWAERPHIYLALAC